MDKSFVTFLLLISLLPLVASCQGQGNTVKSLPADSIYLAGRASADGIGKFYQGREIAHVMGAAGGEWLERDSRQQEENTRLAIEKIDLPVTASVADIGAGTGYYSFRLAHKFYRGKVYAVDIQEEFLQYLRNKKKTDRDSVVIVVKGSEVSPNLPAGSIDLALMTDVYHELGYPHEMLQAIKKSLKPGGKILLLEYRAEDPNVPIKPLHKMSIAQAGKEMAANGFTLTYDGEFLPQQHFLLYSVKK